MLIIFQKKFFNNNVFCKFRESLLYNTNIYNLCIHICMKLLTYLIYEHRQIFLLHIYIVRKMRFFGILTCNKVIKYSYTHKSHICTYEHAYMYARTMNNFLCVYIYIHLYIHTSTHTRNRREATPSYYMEMVIYSNNINYIQICAYTNTAKQ